MIVSKEAPNKTMQRRLFEQVRTLMLKTVMALGTQRRLSAKHLPNADTIYRLMESQVHKVRVTMDPDTYEEYSPLVKRKVDHWVDGVDFRFVHTSNFTGLEVSWKGSLKHHRWV